jgi:lysophospholipase L1-like esterase
MKMRKAGRGAVYFLYLVIVTLVGSEIFLRFLLPAPQGYFIWPPHLYEVFTPSEAATPGVSGAGRFRINSLGLRSDEPPPDRQQTIYVFGGSTAIDVYLDQDRAWVQQVQTRLNAAPGEPKTWVGNLARSSMATLHNLLMFEYLLPNLPKPDLFINLVGVNDLQLALKSSYLENMTLETHMSWTFSETPARGNFWQNLAIVRFYGRIKSWWKKSRLGPTQIHNADGYITWKRCRAEAPPGKIVDRLPDLTKALAQYRSNLNELVDRGEAYGAATIFLTQPTIWSDHMGPEERSHLLAAGIGPNNVWCEEKRYYSPRAMAEGMERFNRVLLDVCSDRKLFCIDLAAKVPKNARYFYDEMHFSDAGADLVSELVAKGVLEFKLRNGGELRRTRASIDAR